MSDIIYPSCAQAAPTRAGTLTFRLLISLESERQSQSADLIQFFASCRNRAGPWQAPFWTADAPNFASTPDEHGIPSGDRLRGPSEMRSRRLSHMPVAAPQCRGIWRRPGRGLLWWRSAGGANRGSL